MEPSGGSSPLPASPLPPSPNQAWYESQLASQAPGQAPPSGALATPAPTPPPKRKGPHPAVGVVFVLVIVVVALALSGALDGLFGSGSSGTNPNVSVTNTSASHVCPYSGTPTETYLFTLVNNGNTNAAVSLGFYLNDAQVYSGTYSAPAGTSTPYTVTAPLSSCPPSGSTYYLDVLSVTAA